MPDDDDGWGGTVEEGWPATGHPEGALKPGPADSQFGGPPAPPRPAPAGYSSGRPGPGLPPPGQPPLGLPLTGQQPPSKPPRGRQQRRNRLLIGGAAVAVVAAVVVIVIAGTSGPGGSPKHATTLSGFPSSSAVTSPPLSQSAATPATDSALLQQTPFTGCKSAAKTDYSTPSVVDQILCLGSSVESKVSALGVLYAKFPDTASLDAWYGQTILQANGIKADAGQCTSGTTVNTNGGAAYCEGPFTNSAGDNAREVVVEAPATINLTNGPNSSSASCPSSAFTLLAFTSPTDRVGVLALSCSGAPSVANAFQSSLSSRTFDLKH